MRSGFSGRYFILSDCKSRLRVDILFYRSVFLISGPIIPFIGPEITQHKKEEATPP